MRNKSDFQRLFAQPFADNRNPFEPGTTIFAKAARKIKDQDDANPFEPGTKIFEEANERIKRPVR